MTITCPDCKKDWTSSYADFIAVGVPLNIRRCECRPDSEWEEIELNQQRLKRAEDALDRAWDNASYD